jgi:two-component system response regulator DegU
MEERAKVALISCDPAFRQELGRWLRQEDAFEVLWEARDGGEAARLGRGAWPDVILVDVPGSPLGLRPLNGPDGAFLPGGRVVLLLGSEMEHLVLEALRWGAQGYLIKEKCQAADVISAVQAVRQGEAVLSPRVLGLMMDDLARRGCSGSQP